MSNERDKVRAIGPGPSRGTLHNTAVRKMNRAERMRVEARLHRLGWRYTEVGTLVGVSASTVARDIRILKEYHLSKATQDIKIWVAELLLVLDDLEAEALAEWETSKTRKRTRTTVKRSGKAVETTTVVEQGIPSLAALNAALSVQDRKMKLLNLDGDVLHQMREALLLSGGLGLVPYIGLEPGELDRIRRAYLQKDTPPQLEGVGGNGDRGNGEGES